MLDGDDATGVRFGVLGPVKVWRHGVELDLGARQQRLILALLLANTGQPVGVGDIVEVLWNERPPRSAVNVVHRYVGALRRLLEPGLPARTAGSWLLGDAAGYRMQVGAATLDLLEMRDRAEQARSRVTAGQLAEAMTAYEQALSLVRGPCGGAAELASSDHLAFSVVDHECGDLAREAAAFALRQNRTRAVLPFLRRVAEHREWDEALQAQLLLALSADGQQAEAIAVYRNIRRRLADELGVDPGEELREAYQLLLSQSADRPGSPGEDGGPASNTLPASTAVLPAQLPADLPHFTGRDEAQRRTLSLVNGHVLAHATMPVLAIDGIPGIGKTAMAIRLAHQLKDAYPDGQLYVDLQGFDPGQAALSPAEALQGFLNALGVPDAEIPASHHARPGLYRSVLAGRRVLLVLDNARDVEQVRPLLPGAPGCLVLVTSRKRLTGLSTANGAHLLTLDVLSVEDARTFLSSRIGAARTAAEPVAVNEIVERCGRLPLALAVVAARALIHADYRLSDIARGLRDAQGSLDGFAGDDMGNDLRAIFSWSYRMLGAAAARMFRLLSLHPGPDVTVPAMASLAGVSRAEARTLAGELVRTGLLAEHQPSRFATHDLIRAYAHELVGLHEDDNDREQAFHRLVGHYRQTAYAADLLLGPTIAVHPPEPVDAVTTARLATATDAMEWFSAERLVLKAVVQREIDEKRAGSAWRLVLSVQRLCHREGWWYDWTALAGTCLRAATEAGDDLGRAHMLRSLSGPEIELGDLTAAARHLGQSLELFDRLGLRREQSLVYRNLGQVSVHRKEYAEAVGYFESALRVAESLGELSDQVNVLSCLAGAHGRQGDFVTGMDLADRALSIAEALGNPSAQALGHETRAEICLFRGDLRASLASRKRAAELFRQAGWRMNAAGCLHSLGESALALGDRAAARAAWVEALDLLRHLHVPDVAKVQESLAGLDETTPEQPPARH
ncbi:AfsR/SARP family transcriptional regulator [Paractinoplanes brasiliensis]|nr:BTAD domain-containing putative transcriptional regulator [Actinoplanes brasiliensis]GID32279.1 SARP family transcriptional regulator [Actinoplanes brasiliensis]